LVPFGASLPSSTGSSLMSGMKTDLSRTSTTLLVVPGGSIPRGYSRVLIISLLIEAPRGMSSAATTTGTDSYRGISALARFVMYLFTPRAADPPNIRDKIRMSPERELIGHLRVRGSGMKGLPNLRSAPSRGEAAERPKLRTGGSRHRGTTGSPQ